MPNNSFRFGGSQLIEFLGTTPHLRLLLVVAWMALVESKAQGLNYLLSVFCLVWGADIGAYFGGRAFGKHKLAPSISPGKSWEGVVAGMVAVLLLELPLGRRMTVTRRVVVK